MDSKLSFSSCVSLLLVVIIISTGVTALLNQGSGFKQDFLDTCKEIDICVFEEWNKTFGGTSPDGLMNIRHTSDNGFIMTGYSYTFSQGKEDIWIVKTDSNGYEEWNVSFGSVSHDQGVEVIETMDESFLAIGQIYSAETRSYDASLIKITTLGNIEWNKTFHINGSDSPTSICKTNDDGYLIVVNAESAGTTDCFIIKVDKTGEMLWKKSVGEQCETDMINGFSLIQTEESGFLLTGQLVTNQDDLNGFLIQIDESGTLVWMNTYGGTSTDFFRSVASVENGYILCGTTKSYGSGNYDMWLLKANENGDELWNTSFGGASFEEAYTVQPVSNEGFIIGGYTFSFGKGKSDAWILKTDQNGIEQWNETFGGVSNDKAYSIQYLQNNKYMIAGNLDGDGWVIKIHSLENKPVKNLFFIGLIKNVHPTTQNVSHFTSKQVIAFSISPIQFPQHLHNETIIISNKYTGFLNDDFIYGLFKAIIL